MVFLPNLRIVARVDDVVRVAEFANRLGIHYPELAFLVDEETAIARACIHFMILPHRIDKERLHCLLLIHLDRVDGVHQVGVVEHDLGGLFGEVLSGGVDKIQQSGVREVLDVVHHRGATRFDILCQFADVRGLGGSLFSNLIKEFLDFREVFQFDLFDEQNVDLGHHVHRLQQVFAVVAVLLEEGVEAMMDVILKIAVGRHFRENLTGNLFMMPDDVVEGVRLEVVACEQVDKLAEREAAQVVAFDDAIEFRVLIFQAHHAGTREHYLQVGEEVVALPEFTAPVGLFEDLVDEEHPSAMAVELPRKVGDAMSLKIEIVHVDIQALLVEYIEVFLGVLQEECRFADATGPLDANHPVAPIDLIHQGATNRGIHMLNEVSVRSEKCFHSCLICSNYF